MLNILQVWYKRYLCEPQAVYLLIAIAAILILMRFLSELFVPLFTSLVIAYLLEDMVIRLEKWHWPHWLAVTTVFLFFISLLVLGLFVLLPLLWHQASALLLEFPAMVGRGSRLLITLTARYPDLLSTDQFNSIVATLKTDALKYGRVILSLSVASISTLFALVIYLVLVPMLVYLFLLDKARLSAWCNRYLPKDKTVISAIWHEVDMQLGNYIRGKLLEVVIVALIAFILFSLLHLNYAVLLGVLVGVATLIPILGAVMVSVPVVLVAFLEWGWGSSLLYFLIAYSVLLAVDANVLVPLLFSEAVKIHPVAIIIAILFFGAIWGFWGIFFAIPLAILLKALLQSWPRVG
ncbi:MAG: family transporter [Gammaproteobacteria bacterium]|jgi:putative permease|nr:family transporter [Gammaproteobacteria bacterium]